jgi:hypothetical protein
MTSYLCRSLLVLRTVSVLNARSAASSAQMVTVIAIQCVGSYMDISVQVLIGSPNHSRPQCSFSCQQCSNGNSNCDSCHVYSSAFSYVFSSNVLYNLRLCPGVKFGSYDMCLCCVHRTVLYYGLEEEE